MTHYCLIDLLQLRGRGVPGVLLLYKLPSGSAQAVAQGRLSQNTLTLGCKRG